MGTIDFCLRPPNFVLSSLKPGNDVLVFWADMESMVGDLGGNWHYEPKAGVIHLGLNVMSFKLLTVFDFPDLCHLMVDWRFRTTVLVLWGLGNLVSSVNVFKVVALICRGWPWFGDLGCWVIFQTPWRTPSSWHSFALVSGFVLTVALFLISVVGILSSGFVLLSWMCYSGDYFDNCHGGALNPLAFCAVAVIA